jgi:hypothetical protein
MDFLVQPEMENSYEILNFDYVEFSYYEVKFVARELSKYN